MANLPYLRKMKTLLVLVLLASLNTIAHADYPFYSISGIKFKCNEKLKLVEPSNGWPTYYWKRNVGSRYDEVKVSVVDLQGKHKGDAAVHAAADAIWPGTKKAGASIKKVYPGGFVMIHLFTTKLPAARILVVETTTSGGLTRYFVAVVNPGIEAGRAEKMLVTMHVTSTQ